MNNKCSNLREDRNFDRSVKSYVNTGNRSNLFIEKKGLVVALVPAKKD
jgi:hypothetical protein